MSHDDDTTTPFARFFRDHGFRLAIACAVVLGLSTCLFGFFIDDYVHILSLEGRVPSTSTFDLFCFADGAPGGVAKLMGFLPFPWFTDLDVRLHFFRPLSSATMALDLALFGRNPLPFHLHSMLWYVAFVAISWKIFRRALPAALAGLAIVLFALDFGHLFATAWWSNRNALVAAVPALAGFWAHLRWREDGWKPGLPLSLLGYATGLLGGEMALCVFGYVGAYELFGRRDPVPARLRALVPGALVGAAYLILYKLGNYGTSGSGVYTDPVGEPLQYLINLPERILMLIAAQFFLVPVELPVGNTALYWPIIALCLLATGVMFLLIRDAWRDFDDATHRGLIWLCIGGLLSAAPVLSTFASARLLLIPSLGAIPLLAAVLLHLSAAHRTRAARTAYYTLLLLHVVIAPLAWPALSLALGRLDATMRASILKSEFDEARASEQIVIVPVAPDPMMGMYTVILREYVGLPRVGSWNALSMAQCAHRISRPTPNRLELELIDGEILETVFERLMRNPADAFHVGERIELPKFTVEILGLGKQGPNHIAFDFPGDLDQPPYTFLGWKEDRLAKITPPAVGTSIDVPFDPGILKLKLLLTTPAPES